MGYLDTAKRKTRRRAVGTLTPKAPVRESGTRRAESVISAESPELPAPVAVARLRANQGAEAISLCSECGQGLSILNKSGRCGRCVGRRVING